MSETYVEGGIKYFNCTNENEFLSLLGNTKIHFEIENPIFRGQADYSWPLLPTAFRDDGLEKLTTVGHLQFNKNFEPMRESHYEHETFHNMIELIALARFLELLHDDNRPIPPGYTWEIRNKFKKFLRAVNSFKILEEKNYCKLYKSILPKGDADPFSLSKPKVFPDKKLISLFAFAQHYGVPTRFLDWTEDFRVASYFAGKFAIDEALKILIKNGKGGKEIGEAETREMLKDYYLGVWVCDVNFPEDIGLDSLFEIIEPPYFNNYNMRIQKGVFTIERGLATKKPLNIYLGEKTPEKIICCKLPIIQAPKLLQKLRIGYSISEKSVFEDLNSYSKYFIDQINYERPIDKIFNMKYVKDINTK